MEVTRKRPGTGDVTASSSSSSSAKRCRDDCGGDIAVQESSSSSELARLLEVDYMTTWTAAFNAPPPAMMVTFESRPYKAAEVFQTMSTSYVTINGNEETCGSSFSDAESSVMASVDTAGRDIEQVIIDGAWYEAEMWAEGQGDVGFGDGAWDDEEDETRGREELVLGLDFDCDFDLGLEWNDAALARFVGEDLIN